MLKKGASLDRSAKKGGNRLYCSVKCLYFLLDGKSCFKSFARVVLKNLLFEFSQVSRSPCRFCSFLRHCLQMT